MVCWFCCCCCWRLGVDAAEEDGEDEGRVKGTEEETRLPTIPRSMFLSRMLNTANDPVVSKGSPPLALWGGDWSAGETEATLNDLSSTVLEGMRLARNWPNLGMIITGKVKNQPLINSDFLLVVVARYHHLLLLHWYDSSTQSHMNTNTNLRMEWEWYGGPPRRTWRTAQMALRVLVEMEESLAMFSNLPTSPSSNIRFLFHFWSLLIKLVNISY